MTETKLEENCRKKMATPHQDLQGKEDIIADKALLSVDECLIWRNCSRGFELDKGRGRVNEYGNSVSGYAPGELLTVPRCWRMQPFVWEKWLRMLSKGNHVVAKLNLISSHLHFARDLRQSVRQKNKLEKI